MNLLAAVTFADGTAGALTFGVAGAYKIDMTAAMKAYTNCFYAWSWSTRDPWPTSLPGVAV